VKSCDRPIDPHALELVGEVGETPNRFAVGAADAKWQSRECEVLFERALSIQVPKLATTLPANR
jgi:hypothetical protein